MLSAEYGFMDYLHGHYPDSANHRDRTFEIKFPATEKQLSPTNTAAATTDMSTTVTVPEYVVSVSTGGYTSYLLHKCSEISNDPDYTAKAALSGLPVKYESTHELALLSVLRAVDGLNGSLSERLRVVCLRAQCLLIISHSRLPHELLHPYMKAGSAILKDLIALSDISSESFSSLQLETSSYSAVNLFLNSAHGILEFNLRRRGPLLPDILQELGLSRAGEGPLCVLGLFLNACCCCCCGYERRKAEQFRTEQLYTTPVDSIRCRGCCVRVIEEQLESRTALTTISSSVIHAWHCKIV